MEADCKWEGMMNFIFISPQFPVAYWNFCARLKDNGVNVLGIGDTAYKELTQYLKSSLTEYYKVDDMENYEQMYRAVAYFSFKYGKIDWLESNNEYWLVQDAKLRTDFHITTGFQVDDMGRVKQKSCMKEYYIKANIPTARYVVPHNVKTAIAFAESVGFPVVVKPNMGVGAVNTFKLRNRTDIIEYFDECPTYPIIMEEYIDGEICSYDAIINSRGEPLFESGNITPRSILDIVNKGDSAYYYIVKNLSEDIKEAGRRCVKSFHVRSRFIHLEFFRRKKNQKGVGKKGEIVGLEVNMRPPGGLTPDMLNYANSTDVYEIWADMVAFDQTKKQAGNERYFCAYVGRRDSKDYVYSHTEVLSKYRAEIMLSDRMPDVLAPAMGNQMYLAKFKEKRDMSQFFAYVLAEL